MLFDSHTHIQLAQYDGDRDEVMRRALAAGVWMVNVGTDLASSRAAVALASAHTEGVYASVGLHPNDAAPGVDFTPFEALARNEKVVGIGETGLDYYRFKNIDVGFKQLQQEVFIRHIALARAVNKPLIIHCREAHEDLFAILKSYFLHRKSVNGVMHFFTGTKEDARRYLDLGLYISFSGVVTFTRDYDDIVRYVPLDRVLVETDAPFAAPVPHRGKRNEPSFVAYTARKIAELKGIDFEEIAEKMMDNAKTFFHL